MTLYQKTLLIIGLSIMGLLGVLYSIAALSLLRGFADIEERSAFQNVSRVLNAVDFKLDMLNRAAADWSHWDDAALFAQTGHPRFIRSNLPLQTYHGLGVNVIIILNARGRVLYGREVDLASNKSRSLPPTLLRHLSRTDPLVRKLKTPNSRVMGIVILPPPRDPLLIVSHPIVSSDGDGPIRGTLLMGRYLDRAEMKSIGALTNLTDVQLFPRTRDYPPDVKAIAPKLVNEHSIRVLPCDKDTMVGYGLLHDTDGQPAAVIRVQQERPTYVQGEVGVWALLIGLLVGGALFGWTILTLLQRMVLARVAQLGTAVSAIGASGELTARVPVSGRDELTKLGEHVNGMLQALEDAQREREESEAYYHAVIEQLAEGVALIDRDALQVVDVNATLEQMLDYTREEMQLLSMAEVLPRYEELREEFAQVLADDGHLALEERLSRKDGTLVDVELGVTPITHGAHCLLCVVVRDITARKEAEAALRFTQFAMDHAADSIFWLNADGRLIYANDAACHTLGYPRAALLGMHATDITAGIAHWTTELAQIQHEGSRTVESMLRTRDERAIPVETTIGYLAYNGEEYLCAFARDITARKEAEARQRAMTEGLRAVLLMADELLACPTMDDLLRRAVELPRERLGLERTALFLCEGEGEMRGTYGTDMQGHTTDEHARRIPMEAHEIGWTTSDRQLWEAFDGDRDTLGGAESSSPGAGWTIRTPIYTRDQQFGSFFNDYALTDAAIDEAKQDLIALYGSLLGNVIRRRQAEEHQEALAEGMRAVLDVADDLLACPTVETFLRRAVELARERLGVERCAIYLGSGDDPDLHGMYGTNMAGETTDEHALQHPLEAYEIEARDQVLQQARGTRWFTVEKELWDWDGRQLTAVGRGWNVITPFFIAEGRFGLLANDSARSNTPLNPVTQEIIAIYCSLLGNILQRKTAEEALAAETERLAVTLRSIGDGVITTDRAGRVVLLNQIAELLTGWTQEDAVGLPLEDVFQTINEHSRQRNASAVERVLRTGSITDAASSTMLVSRDGTERLIAESGAPIRDRHSQIIGVVLVFRDITTQRKIELELRNSDKLESIGVLAGGIAHDFNNLLAAVIGNLSLARLGTPADSVVAKRLVEAERASLRARDLTQQLLTFAQGGAPVKKTASIAEVIEESIGFALLGSKTRCNLTLPDNLWPVSIDTGQISQVLSNLVINADQSMPNGGVITVEAENIMLTAAPADPVMPAAPPGPYVRITVADQGVGIPSELLPKIFDPYFTTKQRGSGLGLTTSYSIVRQHDGVITVDSHLGEGTTFTIYLPATPEAVCVPPPQERRAVPGYGHVLVMDDEPLVRDVVVEMLITLGYDAVAVNDGEQAIAAYTAARDGGHPFDLIIMDLTIPGGMGGVEAIAHLRELDPAVRAIASSGYSTGPVMSSYQKHGFCGVLTKPYKLSELRDIISTLINPATVESE